MIMETEITLEKTISCKEKNVLTQKKKSTEKIMKKKGKKEIKGNKMEHKYSITFKTSYCNRTAI